MNESTRKILQIRVEQAVRPVRASISRKQRMREDLLSHAVRIYTNHFETTECHESALDQTILGLGPTADRSSQLQASVPFTDRITQLLEGPPEVPAWRGALGFSAVVALVTLAALCATCVVVGFNKPWSLQELWVISSQREYLPLILIHTAFVLACFVLVVYFIEKRGGIRLPELPPSVWTILLKSSTRLIFIQSWFIFYTALLFILMTANRNATSSSTINWTILLLTPFMAFFANWGAWQMVRLAGEKRRRHAEWSNLPLGKSSS